MMMLVFLLFCFPIPFYGCSHDDLQNQLPHVSRSGISRGADNFSQDKLLSAEVTKKVNYSRDISYIPSALRPRYRLSECDKESWQDIELLLTKLHKQKPSTPSRQYQLVNLQKEFMRISKKDAAFVDKEIWDKVQEYMQKPEFLAVGQRANSCKAELLSISHKEYVARCFYSKKIRYERQEVEEEYHDKNPERRLPKLESKIELETTLAQAKKAQEESIEAEGLQLIKSDFCQADLCKLDPGIKLPVYKRVKSNTWVLDELAQSVLVEAPIKALFRSVVTYKGNLDRDARVGLSKLIQQEVAEEPKKEKLNKAISRNLIDRYTAIDFVNVIVQEQEKEAARKILHLKLAQQAKLEYAKRQQAVIYNQDLEKRAFTTAAYTLPKFWSWRFW